MSDLNTNLQIIEEFTQRLQVAVLGAEETTANHEFWVTGPEDGTIATTQGPLKTLRGQIADWMSVANQSVETAIQGWDSEFGDKLIEFDTNFSDYLLTIGFEPPVLYASGINIERISQTVVFGGVTYYWTGSLPYVTNGNFSSEPSWLIAPITGGIEIPAFTFATGGQLVRKTQTVLGVDGEWYYWTGVLPKSIPPSSTISSVGGVGEGLFKLASGVFPIRPMLTILATATGNILNSGSFEYGATVPTNNNLLAQLGTGRMYRWAGVLPKVVDINSTPNNSGGIGASAWVLVDSAQGVDGSTVIQETPPTSPTRGMRWSRCSDMKSFIWYVDNDGAQWVEDNPSMGGEVPALFLQEAPPLNPKAGWMWLRCTDMKHFTFYVNAGHGAWIETNPSMGGTSVVSLPVFENDEEATLGGLVTDSLYKTITGEVRIKV